MYILNMYLFRVCKTIKFSFVEPECYNILHCFQLWSIFDVKNKGVCLLSVRYIRDQSLPKNFENSIKYVCVVNVVIIGLTFLSKEGDMYFEEVTKAGLTVT